MKKLLIMLLMIMIVSLGAPSCATAEFEVGPLSISPSQIVAGEPIVAEVNVSNIGGADGDYSANLTIDGRSVETKSVTVLAGATETISFTCCLEGAGIHTVGLGSITETVTALRPAEFEIGSLSLPPEVIEGEAIEIKADIKNTGEVEGTCPVILKVDGVEVGTKDVIVAAGESKTVSFQLTRDKPGAYTIDLEGLTGALRVLKPAEFKFNNLQITSEAVKVGGEATLEADIENIGEVEGTGRTCQDQEAPNQAHAGYRWKGQGSGNPRWLHIPK